MSMPVIPDNTPLDVALGIVDDVIDRLGCPLCDAVVGWSSLNHHEVWSLLIEIQPSMARSYPLSDACDFSGFYVCCGCFSSMPSFVRGAALAAAVVWLFSSDASASIPVAVSCAPEPAAAGQFLLHSMLVLDPAVSSSGGFSCSLIA